jgi:purine-nucleoside/S-methyl-5'-thioadenosine phosphorylase / adenosine deaminase
MTLEILKSDALTAQHGFFTRKGGVSTGIYQGLNCGLGSNDINKSVLTNRTLVANAMQVDSDALQSVNQIHSADVATLAGSIDRNAKKADAMVTATKGIALGILTADCAPILFSDPDAGVIGAAHSGWKGAISGISEATLSAMEALGAKRENITAVVGPSISQRAYEVGPEFFEDFTAHDGAYSRFFAQGTDDRMQFDLPSFCLYRLREAGIGHATWTGHCTYTEPDRFYSYRRTCHAKQADYGRLISVIRL